MAYPYLRDELRCMKGPPAIRPEDAVVDSKNADPQLSAPFFRLPQAIRKTIYSHVFGSGLIHVLSRECESSDRWLPYHSGLTTLNWPGNKKVREYRKNTYAICQYDDWDRYYALSKRCNASAESGQFHFGCHCPNDVGGADYEQRHSRCLRPIRDLEAGDYTSLCDFGEWVQTQRDSGHVREDCEECKDVLASQMKQFGPAKVGGLAKLHGSTTFPLKLLQVCRTIYAEALQTPYKQYTFHFTNCHAVEQFAGRVLTRRQAESVSSVQVDDLYGYKDLFTLQRSFPNLKQLRASSHLPQFFEEKRWDNAVAFLGGNHLEKVDLFRSRSVINEEEGQMYDFTEKFLVCKSISAARALVESLEDAYMVERFRERMVFLSLTDDHVQRHATCAPKSVVARKLPALRPAQNVANGYRSEHELEIDRLKAELADARHQISILRRGSEGRMLEMSSTSGIVELCPFSTIPVELLARIFSFLDQRADIASCRLVCRDFREHSSPFLITEVVYAARAEAIARLIDVAEHPYFSKHVTTLLYDASFYDVDVADEPSNYTDLVHEQIEAFSTHDLSGRSEAYRDLWLRMKDATPEHQRHMFPGPPESKTHRRDPTFILYQGLFEYAMAFETQNDIYESDLPKTLFEFLFSSLPKLRHVRMGDWRNLARAGENFADLRYRLFGKMLAPTIRGLETQNESTWPDFLFLLEMCCYSSHGALQSISISDHPYDMDSDMYKGYDHDYNSRLAVPLDTNFDLLLSDDDPFEKLAGLRSLQLPLNIWHGWTAEKRIAEFIYYCQDKSFVRPLLQACSATLGSLELIAEDGGLLATTMGVEYFDTDDVLRNGGLFLANSLFPVHFTALRSLELRGWLFTEKGITTFLSTVRSTLRELLLLDNVLLHNSGRLAKWGGVNMHLHGVQIDNFLHSQDERPYKLDLEKTWLAGRRNLLTPRKLVKHRRNPDATRLLYGTPAMENWKDYILGDIDLQIFDGPL
ncbi:hypothetical protein CB0940_09647 [Cercospora beticola]|uniref:F-box domain-containing protein n=1 Tax=Cercospora beticola TaxID=122368 RepID=A0A2G5HFR3_CERBT|nr:hypothetical protein CB0940_09647 [Cercospora beticola]PIA91426.1 hypothetical protein CB0940_09647 [Cercospora beticola]WPB06016.1 hypothetical protein RHO25_010671 [Cercospora beticola]CAK1365897.1 unnamed protein product [Cercospora beticola]